MGKTSKFIAPDWLAAKLLLAMAPHEHARDASFDFLVAVDSSSPKLVDRNLKLDNE